MLRHALLRAPLRLLRLQRPFHGATFETRLREARDPLLDISLPQYVALVRNLDLIQSHLVPVDSLPRALWPHNATRADFVRETCSHLEGVEQLPICHDPNQFLRTYSAVMRRAGTPDVSPFVVQLLVSNLMRKAHLRLDLPVRRKLAMLVHLTTLQSPLPHTSGLYTSILSIFAEDPKFMDVDAYLELVSLFAVPHRGPALLTLFQCVERSPRATVDTAHSVLNVFPDAFDPVVASAFVKTVGAKTRQTMHGTFTTQLKLDILHSMVDAIRYLETHPTFQHTQTALDWLHILNTGHRIRANADAVHLLNQHGLTQGLELNPRLASVALLACSIQLTNNKFTHDSLSRSDFVRLRQFFADYLSSVNEPLPSEDPLSESYRPNQPQHQPQQHQHRRYPAPYPLNNNSTNNNTTTTTHSTLSLAPTTISPPQRDPILVLRDCLRNLPASGKELFSVSTVSRALTPFLTECIYNHDPESFFDAHAIHRYLIMASRKRHSPYPAAVILSAVMTAQPQFIPLVESTSDLFGAQHAYYTPREWLSALHDCDFKILWEGRAARRLWFMHAINLQLRRYDVSSLTRSVPLFTFMDRHCLIPTSSDEYRSAATECEQSNGSDPFQAIALHPDTLESFAELTLRTGDLTRAQSFVSLIHNFYLPTITPALARLTHLLHLTSDPTTLVEALVNSAPHHPDNIIALPSVFPYLLRRAHFAKKSESALDDTLVGFAYARHYGLPGYDLYRRVIRLLPGFRVRLSSQALAEFIYATPHATPLLEQQTHFPFDMFDDVKQLSDKGLPALVALLVRGQVTLFQQMASRLTQLRRFPLALELIDAASPSGPSPLVVATIHDVLLPSYAQTGDTQTVSTIVQASLTVLDEPPLSIYASGIDALLRHDHLTAALELFRSAEQHATEHPSLFEAMPKFDVSLRDRFVRACLEHTQPETTLISTTSSNSGVGTSPIPSSSSSPDDALHVIDSPLSPLLPSSSDCDPDDISLGALYSDVLYLGLRNLRHRTLPSTSHAESTLARFKAYLDATLLLEESSRAHASMRADMHTAAFFTVAFIHHYPSLMAEFAPLLSSLSPSSPSPLPSSSLLFDPSAVSQMDLATLLSALNAFFHTPLPPWLAETVLLSSLRNIRSATASNTRINAFPFPIHSALVQRLLQEWPSYRPTSRLLVPLAFLHIDDPALIKSALPRRPPTVFFDAILDPSPSITPPPVHELRQNHLTRLIDSLASFNPSIIAPFALPWSSFAPTSDLRNNAHLRTAFRSHNLLRSATIALRTARTIDAAFYDTLYDVPAETAAPLLNVALTDLLNRHLSRSPSKQQEQEQEQQKGEQPVEKKKKKKKKKNTNNNNDSNNRASPTTTYLELLSLALTTHGVVPSEAQLTGLCRLAVSYPPDQPSDLLRFLQHQFHFYHLATLPRIVSPALTDNPLLKPDLALDLYRIVGIFPSSRFLPLPKPPTYSVTQLRSLVDDPSLLYDTRRGLADSLDVPFPELPLPPMPQLREAPDYMEEYRAARARANPQLHERLAVRERRQSPQNVLNDEYYRQDNSEHQRPKRRRRSEEDLLF